MPKSLMIRVQAIPWSDYESACGFDSTEIPDLIVMLNDDDLDKAMLAIQRLWNVVCHQSNVGSNAVPTLPFLIERLTSAPAELQSKIFDIIYPFACYIRMCAKHDYGLKLNGWHKELAKTLLEHRPLFVSFLGLPDDEHDLSGWAEMIEKELGIVADEGYEF